MKVLDFLRCAVWYAFAFECDFRDIPYVLSPRLCRGHGFAAFKLDTEYGHFDNAEVLRNDVIT